VRSDKIVNDIVCYYMFLRFVKTFIFRLLYARIAYPLDTVAHGVGELRIH